ncbi:hypothetical protein [Georgenia sp. SUBG003]|uniref:hypothetical protein n=1 Tax=Georgenia sp. SUBG003 TaxID=1497974 RepID=UPI000694415B
MAPLRAVVTAAAAGGGVLLGVAVVALGVVRQAKPMHTRGSVVKASINLHSRPAELGMPLGVPGRREATVRFSRGIGLPEALPDIQGLALRVHDASGPIDVLLASTGRGRWSRWLLTFRRRPEDGPLTSLMPYKGPHGPVLLGAEPSQDPRIFVLEWATPRGPWRTFATLECERPPADGHDAPIRFRPLSNTPLGLGTYEWTAQLRRYGYRWAAAVSPALPRSATRKSEPWPNGRRSQLDRSTAGSSPDARRR